jgi:hypothetical protein
VAAFPFTIVLCFAGILLSAHAQDATSADDPVAHSPDAELVPAVAEQQEPGTPAHRPFRYRIAFGLGVVNPTEVNDYLDSKRLHVAADADWSLTGMVVLYHLEASFAYYPIPGVGLRPTLTYLGSPKWFEVSEGKMEFFWMHSIAPGLSIDGVLPVGRATRLFLSPGIAYQVGWLDAPSRPVAWASRCRAASTSPSAGSAAKASPSWAPSAGRTLVLAATATTAIATTQATYATWISPASP